MAPGSDHTFRPQELPPTTPLHPGSTQVPPAARAKRAVRAERAARAERAVQAEREVRTGSLPSTLLLPADALAAIQRAFANSDERISDPLQQLLDEADALLLQRPMSVMDKAPAVASRDMHNYASVHQRWCLNPHTPNGLPYVRHGCERRAPSSMQAEEHTDAAHLNLTIHAVETLAFASFVTGDEQYAAKAVRLIEVWFLNAATFMHPNLDHAGRIPGRQDDSSTDLQQDGGSGMHAGSSSSMQEGGGSSSRWGGSSSGQDGSSSGVMEARHLVYLCDALALLKASRVWTAARQEAMEEWLGWYYQWLRTSRIGRLARGRRDQHGTWYDVQAVGLALCLNRHAAAVELLDDMLMTRIALQVQPDGRMVLRRAVAAVNNAVAAADDDDENLDEPVNMGSLDLDGNGGKVPSADMQSADAEGVVVVTQHDVRAGRRALPSRRGRAQRRKGAAGTMRRAILTTEEPLKQRFQSQHMFLRSAIKQGARWPDMEGGDADGTSTAAAAAAGVSNLVALEHLATLGRHAGVDLWAQATLDGRSLCGAKHHLAALSMVPKRRFLEGVVAECQERLGMAAIDPCAPQPAISG